ncbi:hypothetical protein Goklo_018217, partial [Gossypium klotzschianum]|nr:hypothetical protein [Gossypium klotzschianum]
MVMKSPKEPGCLSMYGVLAGIPINGKTHLSSDQRVEARKEAVFGCEGTTLQPVAIWECKKKLPWSFTYSLSPTVLAKMIQCFDWNGANSGINMEEKAGIALLRPHPLACHPAVRLSPFPSLRTFSLLFLVLVQNVKHKAHRTRKALQGYRKKLQGTIVRSLWI